MTTPSPTTLTPVAETHPDELEQAAADLVAQAGNPTPADDDVQRDGPFKVRLPASLTQEADARTTVVYRATKHATSVDDYEDALLDADLSLYQTTGRLVRVSNNAPVLRVYETQEDGTKRGVSKPVASLCLQNMTATALDDVISRTIRSVTKKVAVGPNGQPGEPTIVPVGVPARVSATILERKGTWKYKTLRGILSCPSIRPDGTLVTAAGYDEATGYYLSKDAAISPEIAKAIDGATEAMARMALYNIRRLFQEFPFFDPETGANNIDPNDKDAQGVSKTVTISESVALADLLSSVSRMAFDVLPAVCVSAPDFGAGKTFLSEIIVYLATGEWPATLFWSTVKEENDKLLASLLQAGLTHVVLDNINGRLFNTLLTQMISSKYPKPRLLGKNETVEREQWMNIHINGVNIAPAEDLERRTLMCLLDPRMEAPKNRKFKQDPRRMVTANRMDYVLCALTILRAYVNAKPDIKVPVLNSFQDWSRLICGALLWLGCPDPVLSQKRVAENDDKKTRHGALMAAMEARYGLGAFVTATQLREDANNPELISRPLREALLAYDAKTEGNNMPSALSIGHAMRKLNGAVLNERYITSGMDSHSKIKSYAIMQNVPLDDE